MDDIKPEVIMTADQKYFMDVTYRISGVKAQVASPDNLVTEESGQHEIARLAVALADVRSRLTKVEVAACKKSMKDWADALFVGVKS